MAEWQSFREYRGAFGEDVRGAARGLDYRIAAEKSI